MVRTLVLLCMLLGGLSAHASNGGFSEEPDWERVQRQSQRIGWFGVGLVSVAAVSGSASWVIIERHGFGRADGLALTAFGLAVVAPPVALASAMRARTASVRRGNQATAILGIAGWSIYGASLSTGLFLREYDALVMIVKGGPIMCGLVGVLAAGQLVAVQHGGPVLASLTLMPVVTPEWRGVAVGLRF